MEIPLKLGTRGGSSTRASVMTRDELDKYFQWANAANIEGGLLAKQRKSNVRVCDVCSGYSDAYMVRDDVWLSVFASRRGRCCLFCLETKLGRPLVLGDFTKTMLNYPIFLGYRIAITSTVRQE